MNRYWMHCAAAVLLFLGLLPAGIARADGASDPAHPFTIVVLSPPPTGPAGDAARSTLEQAAKARGLPVSVVPLEAVDANGVEVSGDALLQSARKLGGAAVLVGRADVVNPGTWQWSLLTGHGDSDWSGPLEAGIQGAADALARASEVRSGPVINVIVTVQGVASLKDYAAVSQLLANLPATQSSGLATSAGDTATFLVAAHGGAEAVNAGLSGSHLTPVAGVSGLTFRYQP